MINNYRTEIETASRLELIELIESYALGIDYYSENLYELREYTLDALERENNLFESAEDDILDTIMNGNWTDAAKQMHENYITPHGLVDYVNDYRYEEFDSAYEFFDLESAVSITELYNQMRKEVA
jgi:hypothetical protein